MNELQELRTLSRFEREDDGVNIAECLDTLARGKLIIVSALLSVMVLAGLYVLLTPPIYQADALLRVDNNQAFLNNPLRGAPPTGEVENPRAQKEVEILRSRSVLGKVVADLELATKVSPEYFPLIGEALARRHDNRERLASPWWGFARYAWGGETIKVTNLRVPDRYLGKELTLLAQEAGRYRLLSPEEEILAEGRVGTSLEVDVGEGAPVVLLVTELVARPGTHFTLTKRSQLSAIDQLENAITVMERTKDTDIIAVELKGHHPEEIAHTVNDIATAYVRKTVAWESAEAEQKLRFLEQQLPLVKNRLELSEGALTAFRHVHRALDVSAETGVLLKQISEMEMLAIQLNQKEDDLRRRLGFATTHPQTISVKAQIARVDRMLAGLNKRVERLPHVEQDMVRLSREVQVNTELYTSLLNSAHEQRVAAAGTIGNARIVDFAVTPENQIWPKPGIVFILAGIFGLFSGTAAVFLRRSLRRRVQDPALVEQRLGLPIYATIPHSVKQEKLARLCLPSKALPPTVLADLHPEDISVESLRGLRTTLYAALSDEQNKVLMVCSPGPGMGKSFISANFAAVLASTGKRVLVIDADLRNGRLHEVFAAPREPGLAELVGGVASFDDVISDTPTSRVHFISRGRKVPNPSELLMEPRLQRALKSLQRRYDHIIIDSPPVLSVTDAAIIGQLADTNIMVIKEDSNSLREIELGVKRLRQAGVNPRGFLINDTKRTTDDYPYYGRASIES